MPVCFMVTACGPLRDVADEGVFGNLKQGRAATHGLVMALMIGQGTVNIRDEVRFPNFASAFTSVSIVAGLKIIVATVKAIGKPVITCMRR